MKTAKPDTHFIIRHYLGGDETKINDMFNEVFHQSRDLSHWLWKYRENPYGSHFISLALSEDGMLAAHYGGYPVILYFRPEGGHPPEEFMTFHLGDKMSRKQFRSAGFGKTSLLTKTFMSFKDSFAKETVPFGYGFGTHHSLRFGLLFLDYADIEPVPYRKIKISALKVSKTSALRKLLLPIKVQDTTVVDREWTEFFYRNAPFYKYLIKRDAAYLKWRYLQRPDRKYLILAVRKRAKLVGWSVFFREGASIIWGDALFSPYESVAVQAMLDYLKDHSIFTGADTIECWFPQRPDWWDNELKALGFVNETEPRNLHLTGPMFNDAAAPEKLGRYFYYTMGDSDLF